jgi:hypothetical protein
MTTVQSPNGRGCGEREVGKLYICSDQKAGGKEVEYFIPDPFVKWPTKWHRGMELIKRENSQIYDLAIFVGKNFYPALWDFVEEVRRFGASRKMSPTVDISKLTPGKSMMLFVHKNVIPKFRVFSPKGSAREPFPNCKRQIGANSINFPKPEYHSDETMCAFMSDTLASLFHPKDVESGVAHIKMPSFTYTVNLPMFYESLLDISGSNNWQTGCFLMLPITHFEGKEFLNQSDIETVNKAGFTAEILGY